MQYRTLGKCGWKVSLLGFGTGGPGCFGQHIGLSAQQQQALVHRAFELGVNVFDTSQIYGQSEVMLGRALQGLQRQTYILTTKWKHVEDKPPGDTSQGDGPVRQDPNLLVEAVEHSLRQLATDYIDVFFLHGVRPEHYDEVADRFGAVAMRLKEQGKIRAFGLSERFIIDPKHEAVVRALTRHPQLWDVVMLKYGILNQWAAREALPLAQKHGTGVLNMAAVRIKLPAPQKLMQLIAEWKQQGKIEHDSLPEQNPLDFLVHDDVASVIAAAYKFAADQPAVSSVLTGTNCIAHLEDNIAAIEPPCLSEADMQQLRDLFGDIAEYA
jgi:aryl-alcohol dehydrogenase-like predicted oxidoreductase